MSFKPGSSSGAGGGGGSGTVTAGAGLTGGGDIGTNPTINVGAGDGIDVAANTIAVAVTDIVGTGLESDGSNNLRIAASAAGDGLTGGAGSALAVGAGTGISVAADAVSVAFAPVVGATGTNATYEGGTLLGASAEETVATSVTLSAVITWHNINTSGGAVTPVLPSAAATGSLHVINDSTGSFDTNNCTVDPEGTDTINGSASSVVLSREWGTWTFKKLSASAWQLLGGAA